MALTKKIEQKALEELSKYFESIDSPVSYARDTWLASWERAWTEATENTKKEDIEIIKRYLLFDSQRAVSWHEINDAIDAILKTKPEA